MIPTTNLYTVPSRCQVCGKNFLARYNVGKKGKVCTPPGHDCTKGTNERGKVVPCVEKCCRTEYRSGATAVAMDQAIDEHKLLTDDEFLSVIRESYKVKIPIGLVIRFIAGTGCRLGESLLCVKEDFYPSGSVPTIKIPTLKRKGRPRRTVDLLDEILVAELDAARNKKKSGPFFICARRTVQYHFSRILEKLALEKTTGIHILRHTRASQLSKAGAKPTYIRQQLGWSSLEMAKIYIHSDIEDREGLIGKLPSVGRKRNDG